MRTGAFHRLSFYRQLLLTGTAAALACAPSAPPAGAGEPGQWEPLDRLGLARQETGAARIGNEVYVAGGLLAGSPLQATAAVEVYDLTTGQWRFGEHMPVALDHLAVAASGGRLFVIGGYAGNFQPRSEVWIFDPADSSWTSGEPLPSPRGAGWAVAHGDRIFLFGGVGPNGTATRTTFIYDPVADDWSQGLDMPTAREHLNAVAAGPYIYVIGGRAGASTGANERYDPVANQWATMAPMPTPRSAMVAEALGNTIFAAGGEVPMLFAVNQAYTIGTNSWSTATPMAVPRHGVAAVSLGDRILAPGGGVVQGLAPTDYVDAYRPEVVAIAGGESPAPIASPLGVPAPNPCPASARFALTLAEPQVVRIVVADVLGRTVRQLIAGEQPAGAQELQWDGRDAGGRRVPAGVYWIRLEREAGGGEALARKLVVGR